MTWNKKITQAREARGIKKSELARMVGVSAPTVTDWESGEIKKIDGENLLKLSAALGVTADWLLNGSVKSQPPALQVVGQDQDQEKNDLVDLNDLIELALMYREADDLARIRLMKFARALEKKRKNKTSDVG